ncbi:hypothetical protein LTR85_011518 [Meristemomyces frigidus]|nr:hypothetical protein LTR85_011518 [Meristemomyces frigidus]
MRDFIERESQFLLNSALKNKVIDELTLKAEPIGVSIYPELFNCVWVNTADDAGLRRFLLDLTASTFPEKVIRDLNGNGDFPANFVYELAVRAVRYRNQMSSEYKPAYKRRYQYHDHQDDEERSRCSGAEALSGAEAQAPSTKTSTTR